MRFNACRKRNASTSPSNPALRILLRAFDLARPAFHRMSQALGCLATLGPLLGSAFQASPSNPALRILLRAFDLARHAFHRMSQALGLTLRRA